MEDVAELVEENKPALKSTGREIRKTQMPVQKISIEPFASSDENKYIACKINFSGNAVALEYTWGGRREVYQGHESPETRGKYELKRTMPDQGGSATLYVLPGHDKAMCRWREHKGPFGWWEIDLEEDNQFSN